MQVTVGNWVRGPPDEESARRHRLLAALSIAALLLITAFLIVAATTDARACAPERPTAVEFATTIDLLFFTTSGQRYVSRPTARGKSWLEARVHIRHKRSVEHWLIMVQVFRYKAGPFYNVKAYQYPSSRL